MENAELCFISFVKIKGFLWYRTESDWYQCYAIWVNKATYTQTLFSSAFYK